MQKEFLPFPFPGELGPAPPLAHSFFFPLTWFLIEERTFFSFLPIGESFPFGGGLSSSECA